MGRYRDDGILVSVGGEGSIDEVGAEIDSALADAGVQSR